MEFRNLARAVILVVATVPAFRPVVAVNGALRFQQLNTPYVKDHLRLSRHPEVGGEFTVEFWMLADATIPFCATETDPQGCWSTGNTWFYGNFIFDGHQNFEQNPGRDSFDVVLANSGRLKVVLDPGSSETDGNTDVVSDGQWHHVAVVRRWVGADEHQVRIYVDGTVDGEATYAGRSPLSLIFPYWGTERADWVGAGPADFPDYFGAVDEIRYWSVARTQIEIQQAMNDELTGTESGLVHYYRLNERQGALANDMVADNDGIFFNLQPGSWIDSTAPIVQQTGPDCGDGLQNQGEQGVDCAGPCPPCAPATEEACADGQDDDLDGLTDCSDPDCATDPACNGVRIEANDRDADYNPLEGVMLGNFFDGTQICIGDDGVRSWQMGLQFRIGIDVPATITSARLELTASGDNSGALTTNIFAVDQDQIQPFVAGSMPSFTASYPLTDATASWTPPAASTGTTVEAPELRELVQEVLDRPGWQSGNFLGLILTEAPAAANWRCYRNFNSGSGEEAVLRLAAYTQGTPVCLDVRDPTSDLIVVREPAQGCPVSSGSLGREFIFGLVGDWVVNGGQLELGLPRCSGGSLTTTEQVVTSRDPDPGPLESRYYLWRFTGDPDFGQAALPDGSEPARSVAAAVPCP